MNIRAIFVGYPTNIRGHALAVSCLRGPIYSSINRFIRRIYGPTCQIHAPAPHPSIFIGDVSPMNVTGNIHQFHITNEYTIIFISTDE
jgi:hypothetical protein